MTEQLDRRQIKRGLNNAFMKIALADKQIERYEKIYRENGYTEIADGLKIADDLLIQTAVIFDKLSKII